MSYSSKINLSIYSPSVVDQGRIGSCAENALSTTLSLLSNETGHPIAPLSRLQVYYDVRTLMGTVSTDSGSDMHDLFVAAQTKGFASETSWNYSHLITDVPTAAVVAEASLHKVDSFDHKDGEGAMNWVVRENWIKSVLSEGKTVLMSALVPKWFTSEHGALNTLNIHGDNTIVGDHAFTIVGYDDALDNGNGAFIIQNSWGTTWGDHGLGVIGYNSFGMSVADGQLSDIITMDVVTGFNGVDLRWTDAKKSATDNYISAFGRAPDNAGLTYWANSGTMGRDLLKQFFASTEWVNDHAGNTELQIINDIYHDGLGRLADTSGANYWIGQHDSGTSWSDVAYNIQYDVKHQTSTSDIGVVTSSNDYLTFSNKENLGMSFAVTFQQNSHLDLAHAYMDKVTSNTTDLEILKVGIAHDLGII